MISIRGRVDLKRLKGKLTALRSAVPRNPNATFARRDVGFPFWDRDACNDPVGAGVDVDDLG